ncbi:trans-cinnamate 4-monooxygenase [Canna indica]|uniref:Trans-cinnamate 4-monooxygenase n=1 Tax=Canna indica TaxID=4628 RepID=A0AAQ3KUM0_9LILI|nr:trans-cinnamate 4-monooxygenase [Canna indica]
MAYKTLHGSHDPTINPFPRPSQIAPWSNKRLGQLRYEASLAVESSLLTPYISLRLCFAPSTLVEYLICSPPLLLPFPAVVMDLVVLEKALLGLFAAVTLAIVVSKLCGKRFKLPPGPKPVPIFGNWLQVGDDLNHRMLTDLAKRFGDIFHLLMGVRNLVVVSTPELAREVLHAQGVEFGSRTRNVVLDIFTDKGQDMVFTVYGDHWRKMRRIMTVPFFTNKVVQQNREGWEEEARLVVEELKRNPKAATEGVIIRQRLQLMMYNNMYRIMFDKRFDSVDDPLFNKLKAINFERSRLSQSFEYNYGDFIPVLRPFLRKYLNKCKEVKDRRLRLFHEHFVAERKKMMEEKGSKMELKCAIDHILDAEMKGEINYDNVLYIVENINVAALETTLWSIEWGIAELVNNPAIQRKLRAELDAVLGRGHQLTEPDLQRLPYLNAVVKEALRYRMAIPLLVPHMNLHDARLAGFDIPAESKILVNAWWLANNPALWKNPEEFRPERFLEEEAKVEANGSDFRFLPFGAGRRSCPGIIHALPIIGIILGCLVQNFELLPPPGQDKIDTTEKPGQFSLQIMKHSTVVCKPRA